MILAVPGTRDGDVDLLPAIFVDSPAWDKPVATPATVCGVAHVFEATFRLLVTDDQGGSLWKEVVIASCGPGC